MDGWVRPRGSPDFSAWIPAIKLPGRSSRASLGHLGASRHRLKDMPNLLHTCALYHAAPNTHADSLMHTCAASLRATLACLCMLDPLFHVPAITRPDILMQHPLLLYPGRSPRPDVLRWQCAQAHRNLDLPSPPLRPNRPFQIKGTSTDPRNRLIDLRLNQN